MHRWATIRSQLAAALLLPVILPILGVLYVVVVLAQGRPFLFTSERMRDPETTFRLYKIRTMRPDASRGEGVMGGPNRLRVTPVGRFLRRVRLDELPQIFNVLKGDIGFIGPRPPLRDHVMACPRRYRRVLASVRPGITGLSTVMVHRREERLLSRCRTAEEAEAVYRAHCLPLKLRLDQLYAEKGGLALDLLILWRTFARLSPSPEATPHRPTRPNGARAPSAAEDLPLAA